MAISASRPCVACRDTARIELWDCPLSEILLIILVRFEACSWEAIEEGVILRELTTRFDLSQRELSCQTGRDVSWINRRLSLVQEVLEADHGIQIPYSTLTR